MTDIYWFQHDLRLQDNPGLLQHSGAKNLLLVYVWPESRPWCNVTGMGKQRRRFLLESLAALRKDLAALGQDLLVLSGQAQAELPRLARDIGANRVGTSMSPGYYERRAREQVAAILPIPLQIHAGNMLFTVPQLPFSVERMPSQFTPFKNDVEGITPASTTACTFRITATTAEPGFPCPRDSPRPATHRLPGARGQQRWPQTPAAMDFR